MKKKLKIPKYKMDEGGPIGNEWSILPNDTIRTQSILDRYKLKNGLTPDYIVHKKQVVDKPQEEGWLDKVDNVLSAPQRAATYALTGKYQNPSEALGIKNEWGKMAVDMVLDPMNLLGVGTVTKGLGKVAAKVLGTTAEHLDEVAKLADKAPLDMHDYGKVVDYKKYVVDYKKYKDIILETPIHDFNKYKNYKDLDVAKYILNDQVLTSSDKILKLNKTGAGAAIINDLIKQDGTKDIKDSYEPHYTFPNKTNNTNPTNNINARQPTLSVRKSLKTISKQVNTKSQSAPVLHADSFPKLGQDTMMVDTPKQGTPEKYMLSDGNKYTYEELIKRNPALKDPKTFERNFGKVSPELQIGTQRKMKSGGRINSQWQIMKIKNKQGHIITVPSHLEDIVRNHINSGNHSEVDNIIKMEQGGPVEPTMINVEKDELLVSPDTKILKEYINKPEHPESGINPKGNTMEQPGNFVIPKKLAKLYKEGDRLRRQTMLMNLQNKQAATNKMEEGGKVNYGMLASSIGGAFQNLGANRSAKAQSPDYGQNMYSTDYSRNMQMGNQIGDGIGAAIPIAGAFKGLGQGASNLVAPSDQYGVRKGSTAQVGIASAIDPLPVTAEAVSNISQGKELGQSAYAFINPIKAGVDMNQRNKANRDRLEVWSKGNEELDNLQNRSYSNDTIKFKRGGRVPYITPMESLDTNLIPNTYQNNEPVEGDTLGQYNAQRGQKNAGDQFNWNTLASGLNDAFLNTMGPASYLREQGKNYDTVKYPDANPNLINDNEQLREADLQNAAYNKDIMSASGGNSGTYLANRLAGLTRNLMNKNRIRENTANTNTQIKNQFNLYNNASKARAIDATAANKGQSLTNYYSAMGNMGKNLAGTSQTIDGRDHQMDLYKVMLQMFPSLNK